MIDLKPHNSYANVSSITQGGLRGFYIQKLLFLPLPLGKGRGEGLKKFIFCILLLNLPLITSAAPYIFNEDSLQLSFNQTASDTVILDGTYELEIQNYMGIVDVTILDQQENRISQLEISDFIDSGSKTLVIFSTTIEQAKLWNAEKPYLYNLRISLDEGNGSFNTNFGIAFSNTNQKNFLVNDTPVKLRGVNYQINSSLSITSALDDLESIKSANVNTVYLNNSNPPHLFLSKCDELGIYVILKASNETFELDYKGVSIHPSFLMWLVDGDISQNEYNRMKELDPYHPVAPIIEPGTLTTLPSDALVIQNASLDDVNNLVLLNKPLFLLSALNVHDIGNLVGYTGYLFESNNIFGMSIDDFNTVLQTDSKPMISENRPDFQYYLIKNAYSPVKFLQNEVQLRPGRQIVEVDLINYYDFTNLQELSATWQLQFDSEIQFSRNVGFNLSPGEEMEAAFPITLPDDFSEHETYLNLLFENGNRDIYKHGIWLKPQNWQKQLLLRLDDLDYDPNWEVSADINQAVINHEHFQFETTASPFSWYMLLKDTNTRLITGGPQLFLEYRKQDEIEQKHYENLIVQQRRIEKIDNNVEIQHPIIIQDATTELTHNQVNILASPYGYMDVKWKIETEKQNLLQSSLEFTLPSTLQNITWSGLGPYPAEPKLESLVFPGIFKFDLINHFYDGNRSNIRAVTLLDKRNYGLGIIMFNGKIGISNSNTGIQIRLNTYFTNTTSSETRTSENIFRIVPILRNNYPSWLHSLGQNLRLN